jgi:exonuclease I
MSAIVWMDMEMSGLEPETDRILEVAVLVTDGELEVVAEGPNLVLHQVDEVLEAMDEWNTSHHGQSGLTQRVRESTIDEAQASAALMAFLAEHTTKKMAPLAGNSIHQDRSQRRCVDAQGAREALVPEAIRRPPDEERQPPRHGRPDGVDRRAEVLSGGLVPSS